MADDSRDVLSTVVQAGKGECMGNMICVCLPLRDYLITPSPLLILPRYLKAEANRHTAHISAEDAE